MAVLSRITCERCAQTADAWHSSGDPRPRVCDACKAKETAGQRAQHFAELDALPVEDRLRRLEAWIYDYRPQWVPPPRF